MLDDEGLLKKASTRPRKSYRAERLFEKVKYLVNFPRRSIFGQWIATLLCTTALVSGGIRLIYGPGHPLNKFMWDRMKARGELSEELLAKESMLNAYELALFRGNKAAQKPGDIDSAIVGKKPILPLGF